MSRLDGETRSLYQDVITYLMELGYYPHKERMNISFKHGVHNKLVVKMGTVKDDEQALFFALRFSACNMAFAYISNPDFKDYYTGCAIDFMTGNGEYPREMISQMVFAEQRMAAMCAKKMNIPVFHFLRDPYQSDNTRFTHIWGGKDIARNDPKQHETLCRALLNKIKEHSRSYYDKLSGNG